MSRTYIPEEDQRVADKSALKDLYPTAERTVYLDSEDNTYFWDTSGDASNANGDTILSSNEPGFQDGDANEGVWRLSPTDFSRKTTDDLAEGSNQYYTDTRARNALSATGDISYDSNTGEFSVTSYSSSDFDSDFSNRTTDDLVEGSSQLYFTEERVDDRVDNLLTPGLHVASTYNDASDSIILDVDDNLSSYSNDVGFISDLSGFTTDDLAEGANNLYYTDDKVKNEFEAYGDLTYDIDPVTGGFDMSKASYSNTSFGVGSEDSIPRGIALNSDGTKMFIIGENGDNVHEYSMSIGFDLSTATYSGTSFNISQDVEPTGIAFNGGGTKMFISGSANDNIYEYGLNTGFDLSTASFTTSFDVSNELFDPRDIEFNNDGTKMFVPDDGVSDSIHEYDLSTAFDVSTASWNRSLDTSSEDFERKDVAFNSDGTKMFVVGSSNQNIYEYNLSTGFDLSTASYSGTNFDIGSEDSVMTGIAFNSDGTTMLLVGGNNADVHQYEVGDTSDKGRFSIDVSEISDLLSSSTTDDLAEGGSNLYFTDERVDDRVNSLLTGGNGVTLSYDDANNTLSIAASDLTTEEVQDDAWAVLSGTQSLINVTYDDANDEVDFVVEPSLSNYTNDAGFLTDINGFTSDDLTEGSYNLYYTDSRVDSRVDNVLPTGQDSFSGDGNQEQFQISHGLGAKPNTWLISSASDDASGISHTTADDTTLYVNYDSAPPSGTGNVVINWMAVGLGTNVAPLWEDQGDVEYEK